MGGQRRGVVDALLTYSGSGQNMTQEVFKRLYDALQAHPNWTLIALNYGDSGTGTDYHDGANPFGENAFMVYRWAVSAARAYTVEMLIQWSYGSNSLETHPDAAPARIKGSLGSTGPNIGVAFCIARDTNGGDESGWNGTTNADGTDTKGTPVWEHSAGGSLQIYPRSNNAGGNYATNRENMMELYQDSSGGWTQDHRWSCVFDDDNIFFRIRADSSGFTKQVMGAGIYTPMSGTSSPLDRPFFAFDATGSGSSGDGFIEEEQYGSLAGNAGQEGGVAAPGNGNVLNATFEKSTYFLNTLKQPNPHYAPATQYDSFDFRIGSDDSDGGPQGFLGWVNDGFFLTTIERPNESVRADLSMLVSTADDVGTAEGLETPWDGATTPGSTATRDGVLF